MTNDIETRVKALEEFAAQTRAHLPFAQRAFVIEFAGTPKSGKSTAVEAIRHFFSRQKFRVHVLAERAALCPIPMKGHLFFNTWCATSMLAELLENVETEADIIIVDRGIFDALVWLRLQHQRGELTHEENQTIESFLLLERWRSLIDLTIVMRVSAEKAMEREVGQRITNQPGSIMNPDILSTITESVAAAIDDYRSQFHLVDKDTTDSKDVRSSNAEIAKEILEQFEEFLNPNILVVPRGEIEKLPLSKGGNFSSDAIRHLISCIENHGKECRRAVAEKDPSLVQIVSCGILTSGDEVFLFQRKENDPKLKLYGSTTVWQGTHVPFRKGAASSMLETALSERITKSLFLSRVFHPEPKGYCWDEDDAESSKHLGVLFKIEIDNSHTAQDLRKKEFRKGKGRGHDLAGQLIKWQTLREKRNSLKLESWSEAVLDGVPDILS